MLENRAFAWHEAPVKLVLFGASKINAEGKETAAEDGPVDYLTINSPQL